ncbi:zinc finger protein ZPR1 [Galendromus occidentalis]|uniref:Zinc finger protein ZPR1 n=1 Tax=Galendromus occidentalis TaxID=34638 RepID=A0AAJ6VW35_9ACAR|nr:zinc finger protein ZPR1 [Galendromus occidentalis]
MGKALEFEFRSFMSLQMAEEKGSSGVEEEIFKDLHADEMDDEVMKIESLCLNCREQGETRLLLTKIPFYKEVVIMSFHCDHCGWSNNELQSASAIQERGQKLDLTVRYKRDLNRQVVKTEYASLTIPEVEFEVAEKSQPGLVTTIEGLIDRAIQGLSQTLARADIDPESREKINQFIIRIDKLKEVERPFHFILEDCSGNSFIENPYHPEKDLQLVVSHFSRSAAHNLMLGLNPETENSASKFTEELRDEVHSFPTQCPECRAPAEIKMKLTDIPHFKEVVIMAMVCEACGHKTNEIKSGGGIESLGKRIELRLERPEDLSRDVLKSETCLLEIPELEFEGGSALITGKFTTIEGLLDDLISQLGRDNPFLQGDSAEGDRKSKLEKFLSRLHAIKVGDERCTLVFDDPCGNSYVQNLLAPEPDPQLKITQYERTFEQNEELGLNDMKTEGYERDEKLAEPPD